MRNQALTIEYQRNKAARLLNRAHGHIQQSVRSWERLDADEYKALDEALDVLEDCVWLVWHSVLEVA